jgi:biopolymer transport protein ExbD
VVIQIAKDNSVKINQEDTSWSGLESRLVDIFKTRSDRVVFIKGDPDLNFSSVAQAIDAAHGANIDKVGLMTPKVEEGK